MFGYHVPSPDHAMLVSGGKSKSGAPFQVIIGHGKFVGPMKRARLLTLAMQESAVTEQCTTKQGIPLLVKAVIAFKIGNDDASIINAGQRFLSDENQMPVLAGRIFAGHLRSIVGAMTVEEIITERQKLATEVLDASKLEMAKIGLQVDSFQIQSIDDGSSGYIQAMSAPHQAAIQRQAKIAQAEAEQAASAAQQRSKQQQVGYERETTVARAKAEGEVATAQQEAERTKVDATRQTAIAQAQAKAEIDKAQATAAQSGPLTQAEAQKAVVEAQTLLARQNAVLTEQLLLADVIKPAEAEASKTVAIAKADAEKTKLQAEAMAAANSVTLDQQLISQLPQIVKEAATGLQGANLTVLNGADGMGEMITGLVTQAMVVLDVMKKVRGESGRNIPETATDKQLPSRAATR